MTHAQTKDMKRRVIDYVSDAGESTRIVMTLKLQR
jgi:hypothetical protein